MKITNRIALVLSGLAFAGVASAQLSSSWSNRYNGPTNRYDAYQSIEIDPFGNAYLTGYEVDSGATGGNQSPVVRKVSPNGVPLWVAATTGADFGPGCLGQKIAVAGDSIYLVGTMPGTSPLFVGISKSTLWKFRATDGALVWRRTFEEALYGSTSGNLTVDSSGNIIVVGALWNDSGFFAGNDAFIQKFDPAGTRLWSTVFHEPINGLGWGQGFHFVEPDNSGNVIATGTHSMGTPTEILMFKYNGTDGSLIWDTRIEPQGSNAPIKLMMAANGDPVLAYNTSAAINNEYRPRIAFQRFDGAAGGSIWTTIESVPPLWYQLASTDQVHMDGQGNIAAALMYDVDGDGLAQYRNNNSMRTYKFNGTNGQKLWERDHGNAVRYDWQNPTCVRVDALGNVWVFGSETLPDPINISTRHTMIMKYDGVSGEHLVYEKFVGEGQEVPYRGRFDGVGSLYLGGISYSATTNQDLWVAKWGVGPAAPPKILTFVLTPSGVVAGNAATGTITLDKPAPIGGTVVSLADNSAALNTPSSVSIPHGQSSVSFAVGTTATTVPIQRQVKATLDGIPTTRNVWILLPDLATVTSSQTTLVGGSSATGTLTANGTPGNGFIVNLTSSGPQLVVPASVTFGYAQRTANFPIASLPVASTVVKYIRATRNGRTRTVTITVKKA
ncbi:MAG: PQQ-binding-like beta-propeller repeat protein [Fimbriimonadaceae bacterium]